MNALKGKRGFSPGFYGEIIESVILRSVILPAPLPQAQVSEAKNL